MKRLSLIATISLTVLLLTGCGVSNDQYQETLSQKETLEAEQLRSSNEEYKKIIEPYKNLSEAELEAKTNEANLKAEKDKKELEEIKAKEAEEKAAKEKEEAKEKEKKEKIGYETGITFKELARTPDDYIGEKVKFSGKVLQVLEGDGVNQMRFAVDSDYDKVIYLEYDTSLVSSRILEDDIITIYGVSYGLYTYSSTMGKPITLPVVLVDKIDQ
ncbi:toxin regulator [Anaerocolumna aminovalerica]|uniref:toxin regulator n=1 Tax=Anaerocolumna aminovalerica TaxID=1527 RepID=UPI001C0F0962|nr:toxin regulator [Anaerocolumna aminovalerica]MBU5331450.1 toxin regulator [Anaerocolumna aminovalerica]